MKKSVDNYKMSKISSRMAKVFGSIPKGHEEVYALMLISLEGNLLKLHRINNKRTGRNALEAIHICLLKIDGYLTSTEYDFTGFITEDNKPFVDGLLTGFDPFTNPQIYDSVSKFFDLSSAEELKKYFEDPVKCLLRIEKSIHLWNSEFGVNGYFNFIEGHLGSQIDRDDKMNFTINVSAGKNISDFPESVDEEV